MYDGGFVFGLKSLSGKPKLNWKFHSNWRWIESMRRWWTFGHRTFFVLFLLHTHWVTHCPLIFHTIQFELSNFSKNTPLRETFTLGIAGRANLWASILRDLTRKWKPSCGIVRCLWLPEMGFICYTRKC